MIFAKTHFASCFLFTAAIGFSAEAQDRGALATPKGLSVNAASATQQRSEYSLRDGDTVVFLGDSITAARTYGKIIENYTLLRFPDRKVHFINAGVGGDTAAGGLSRLKRDVFARGATVLIVAFGVNDIVWGLKTDEEHQQKYLAGIVGIVKECKRRGVRVYICSAAITAADPDKSEKEFLQTMCDMGLARARKLGGGTINVQRGMREIQRKVWAANEKLKDTAKAKTSMHAGDGVHLNELGHLAMAFVILKGLGAPSDVSSVTVNAKTEQVIEATGCEISHVMGNGDELEFTRLDQGLPLNNGLFFGLNFRFIPIPSELNRYMLRILSLPRGRYNVSADGRALGTFSSDQLAKGINIASTTANAWQPGGPWNVQADMLRAVTDARHKLGIARRLGDAFLKESDVPKSVAKRFGESNLQIEEIQRQVARPRPYRFTIRRAKMSREVGRTNAKVSKRRSNPNDRKMNRVTSLSTSKRDSALDALPRINSFRDDRSGRFLVDFDVVRTGHPYKGENSKRPHTGGHVYFKPPARPLSVDDVDAFPPIYAVADGVISRIDYSFRLREMFEPALDRRVANTRYGIGLMFATRDGRPVEMHYSIEPFIDPGDDRFYDKFILVKPGQKVRKGDVIARMYIPPNKQLAEKSHIHFNLMGGNPRSFMAPAIFSKAVVERFHATWGNRGTDGTTAIPPCMGYRLAPNENPFGDNAEDAL